MKGPQPEKKHTAEGPCLLRRQNENAGEGRSNMKREERMAEPLAGFGPYLSYLLRGCGMSASEAARRLGYKSRNSLFRLLDGKGSYAAMQDCRRRLKDCPELGLTQEQLTQLDIALEVSRLGREGYLSNQAMRDMLRPGGEDAQGERWADGGLLDELAAGRQVVLTITGCCDRALMTALARSLPLHVPGVRVQVEHYIYIGGDEIIESIAAIQPLLYASCYMAWGVEPGVFSREQERLYRSNRVLARWEDAQGVWHARDATLVGGQELAVSPLPCGEEPCALESALTRRRARMTPLKAAFSLTHTPQDYLTYTRECAELEHGRAVYTVKLDVPISFIHPDILLRAVRDGFARQGFGQGEEMEALIGALWKVHLSRWQNYFTKRRPTHTIFSLPEMERFARTGEQSDHFFAISPYTPQERADILRHIRAQAESNASFHVHFFQEGYRPPRSEIGLYEGAGTLMAKPDTHYDLGSDHAEILVTQTEFCRRYKEFFVQDLLEHHVMTQEQTFAALDRLIALALGGEK